MQTTGSSLKSPVDAAVRAYMQQDAVTGCSLVLVMPDAPGGTLTTTLLNYGTVSRTSTVPVGVETEYEIGSLTKLFTADLLALYVQDGLMHLDDPLQKYMPARVQVPAYRGQAITLLHLATHTSGLPRKTTSGSDVSVVDGVTVWGYASGEELLDFLGSYSLTRAPGAEWEYSNLAFSLLGMAEEAVGGASYATLIAGRIAEPLAMHDTRIVLDKPQKMRLAQGYRASGQAAPIVAVSGETLAAGALRSTISDMALYLRGNMARMGTTLDGVLLMTQRPAAIGGNPNALSGLGWNITAAGTADERFSKNGSTAGFSSYIGFSRPRQTGFAVLCNGPNAGQDLAPRLYEAFGESSVAVEDGP